jgi:hypothetical protein
LPRDTGFPYTTLSGSCRFVDERQSARIQYDELRAFPHMLTTFDILGRGYFPTEFPPPFTTTSFARAVCTKSGALDRNFVNTFPNKTRHAALGIHNLVRSGGLRRNLGIPHPMPYTRLADFVIQNWTDLQEAGSRSPYSLSRPTNKASSRAISPEHDLSSRTDRLIELRSRARFSLKLDINRFYPSIYTHCLPWAILGKKEAKSQLSDNSLRDHWSDELDMLVRNLNDRQTMGIPIGPDVSRLIAEIILGAVDVELANKLPNLKGIRFIDDYEFSVAERSEAEQVVSDLQSILSHYELALNPVKTAIVELPSPFEPLFISRLRTFLFRDAGIIGQRHDLTAYFDFAFECAKQDPHESTLQFAIARLNSVEIEEDNWLLFQQILTQCAINEPACLRQVCEQLTSERRSDVR